MWRRCMAVGSLAALACIAGCGGTSPIGALPRASAAVEPIRVSDLEKVRADDLGDRLTIVEVPDPRAPDIGNSLESMAVSEDAVWVVSHRGGIVSRIDPATNAVVAAIESPILPGCIPNACVGLGAVAAAGDHVWFLNQHSAAFKRVDARTNEIVASTGASGSAGLLGAAGLIWSGAEGAGGATGMDPATGEARVTVADGSSLVPAGFAAGSVWFAGDECRELLRVDPATGDVQASIAIDTCVGDVVEAADEIWAGTFKGILRIDPATGQELGWIDIRTENDRFSLAVVDDSVWFRGEVTEIVRLDPVTKQPVERIALPFGQYQGEIDVADGSLWVANWGEGTVYRIDS